MQLSDTILFCRYQISALIALRRSLGGGCPISIWILWLLTLGDAGRGREYRRAICLSKVPLSFSFRRLLLDCWRPEVFLWLKVIVDGGVEMSVLLRGGLNVLVLITEFSWQQPTGPHYFYHGASVPKGRPVKETYNSDCLFREGISFPGVSLGWLWSVAEASPESWWCIGQRSVLRISSINKLPPTPWIRQRFPQTGHRLTKCHLEIQESDRENIFKMLSLPSSWS